MTRRFAGALLALLLIASAAFGAEEYKIGPGDMLKINFWQDPTLNTDVRVAQDGTITLDIVGEIDAAGRTTQELQNEIVRQMSRLNKRISQAVVRVTGYNYQYVFVSGQVQHPGKLTFEEIPDLWTIINEAGGAAETGDLSRVTIIRGGDDAGKVEVVDVAAAIASGNIKSLPKIRRGDTIDIPRTPIGLPAGDLARNRERKNLIYVVGAVGTPGPVEYQDNVDVLEAVALAGGPAENADLKKVRIISKDGFYGQSMKINLEKYAAAGIPARYILQKEDVVLMPRKRPLFGGLSVSTVASVVGVVSTSVLLYYTIRDRNRTN